MIDARPGRARARARRKGGRKKRGEKRKKSEKKNYDLPRIRICRYGPDGIWISRMRSVRYDRSINRYASAGSTKRDGRSRTARDPDARRTGRKTDLDDGGGGRFKPRVSTSLFSLGGYGSFVRLRRRRRRPKSLRNASRDLPVELQAVHVTRACVVATGRGPDRRNSKTERTVTTTAMVHRTNALIIILLYTCAVRVYFLFFVFLYMVRSIFEYRCALGAVSD